VPNQRRVGLIVRYLLDTNIIIDAAGGRAPAVQSLREAYEGNGCISAITRLEVFGYPDLTGPEEFALKTILSGLEELPVDSCVIDQAILLRKQKRIKIPDALIAATALVGDAIVVTRNERDFLTVEGLSVHNPWEQ
jgi:predicted nucleic acid-binding protein